MAVITISRQFGSHGDTIAQLICERLGYRYFDKSLMLGLAVQMGLPPDTVVDLSDEQHRARSLVERLFNSFAMPMADPQAWAAAAVANAEERLTVETVKQLIHAAYAQGNVVIMGRGGQAVLHDQPDVLHVRVIAPLELRVRRHAERTGLALDAARDQVLKRDRASIDFVERYYDVDPTDAGLYDLTISTSKVSPAAAADLIIATLAALPARAAPPDPE